MLRFLLLLLLVVGTLTGCASLDTVFNVLETVTFPVGVLGTIAGNPVDTYYTVRKVQDWVSKPSSKPSTVEKEGTSTEPVEYDIAEVRSEKESQKLSNDTESNTAAAGRGTVAAFESDSIEGGEKILEDNQDMKQSSSK
ncbi:MAG: hypothetical protein QW561_00150 [Candidatus Aenigmatarchaeota archaeon]